MSRPYAGDGGPRIGPAPYELDQFTLSYGYCTPLCPMAQT
jgi:hypothetical protein